MAEGPGHEQDADRWLDHVLDNSRRAELDDGDAALADLIASMTAAPTDADLTGFDEAISAFVAARGAQQAAPAPGPGLLRRLLARPAAVVAAAGAVVLAGGMTAAAYTGVLPEPLQNLAHRTIHAPAHNRSGPTATATGPGISPGATGAERHGPASTGSPSVHPGGSPTPGPDATGPAALGLCRAFLRGELAAGSTAYHSLEVAAGDPGIAAYCDTVVHTTPGQQHPSGTHAPERPSAPPTWHPSPTTHPVSPPSTTPPPHP